VGSPSSPEQHPTDDKAAVEGPKNPGSPARPFAKRNRNLKTTFSTKIGNLETQKISSEEISCQCDLIQKKFLFCRTSLLPNKSINFGGKQTHIHGFANVLQDCLFFACGLSHAWIVCVYFATAQHNHNFQMCRFTELHPNLKNRPTTSNRHLVPPNPPRTASRKHRTPGPIPSPHGSPRRALLSPGAASPRAPAAQSLRPPGPPFPSPSLPARSRTAVGRIPPRSLRTGI